MRRGRRSNLVCQSTMEVPANAALMTAALLTILCIQVCVSVIYVMPHAFRGCRWTCNLPRRRYVSDASFCKSTAPAAGWFSLCSSCCVAFCSREADI